MDYRGKVAVVTGASSGLGRQLALDLAAAGAVVVGVARREPELRELTDQMRRSSPKSGYVVCDLASGDIGTTMQSIEETYGPVDVLINNAAMDLKVGLRDIAVDDYRHLMEANFLSAVSATLTVLPGMIERGHGVVAMVSSDGGRLPGSGPGAYPASKAALGAFAESVSYRVRRKGVRVHLVYPAFMPTAMGLAALDRGLRRPPFFARRTVEQVSKLVLRKLGGPHFEINAARVIVWATVFRAAVPRLYQRFRSSR
ncbi:MAG: SDR family NAD(P)-dependent oxidoreductase [Actinobacteria bacterium]|nr:SDR family NAD(P)-dependent oxidoreductase [Actinomycetota bacterium]